MALDETMKLIEIVQKLLYFGIMVTHLTEIIEKLGGRLRRK